MASRAWRRCARCSANRAAQAAALGERTSAVLIGGGLLAPSFPSSDGAARRRRRLRWVHRGTVSIRPGKPYNTGFIHRIGIAMSVYDKLKELNITLQAAPAPAAAYVMFVQTGNLVFLSGHIAKNADGSVNVGQLGKDKTTTDGQAAARAIAIDLLGTLQDACGGDLTRVKRIVKLMSLVNSTPDFTEHHLVTNGASELLGEVFGDAGKHARSAFGVAQIPRGACVEIEMIVEVA